MIVTGKAPRHMLGVMANIARRAYVKEAGECPHYEGADEEDKITS